MFAINISIHNHPSKYVRSEDTKVVVVLIEVSGTRQNELWRFLV
jgi:hypothetical protein